MKRKEETDLFEQELTPLNEMTEKKKNQKRHWKYV